MKFLNPVLAAKSRWKASYNNMPHTHIIIPYRLKGDQL